MPHVRESEPRPEDAAASADGDASSADGDASAQQPQGKLGGHPFNPDETAPGEHAPDPGGRTEKDRHPDSVEGKPGNDL